jgi:hypothetical protein
VTDAVTCSCGATLRIPPPLQGKSLRCPKCGQVVAAQAAAVDADSTASQATAVDAELTCSICLTKFAAGEIVRRCSSCDQLYHEECWAEVGGCGTFGCTQGPTVDKSESTPQAPLTAWGDEKDCPICGETIKSIALKCRYCGATFDTADPLTVADLRKSARQRDQLQQIRQSVIALFVVGLLGACAPLIAVVSAVYLIPKRAELAKCGPLYMIMGWTALGLSCVYSLLMLLFFLAGNL